MNIRIDTLDEGILEDWREDIWEGLIASDVVALDQYFPSEEGCILELIGDSESLQFFVPKELMPLLVFERESIPGISVYRVTDEFWRLVLDSLS